MKLYDEGKLRLDDKVSDLLPWYDLDQKFTDSWPITVRTLLTHSSGLPREKFSLLDRARFSISIK
jgi:CubicO group peptidase (beta-lactamase class C family)